MTVTKPIIYEVINKEGGVSYNAAVIETILFFKHKNIDFDLVSLTLSESINTVKNLTNGEWDKTPLVKFPNGDIVYDSENIAQYLEEVYPENPLFIHNEKKLVELYNTFYYEQMKYCTDRLTFLEVYLNLDQESQILYRKAKELELIRTIEKYCIEPTRNIQQFHNSCFTLNRLLSSSDYIQGETQGYFDYRIIAVLQGIKTVKEDYYNHLVNNNPYPKVIDWANKMNDLFDGYLKNRKIL